MKAAMFLVNGFEEVEAVTPADILRRGGVDLTLVSLMDELSVTGAHDIVIKADKLFLDILSDSFDMLILPGGPGTKRYKGHTPFLQYLSAHYNEGKKIAAICAAPSIFGMMGFLEGKRAVCYSGYEPELKGAQTSENAVETDGNIITSRSAATAMLFGFALLDSLAGNAVTDQVKAVLLYQ